MNTTLKTAVHKRTPLHFLVDGFQVWVSYLDANENGPFGVRFKWMEDEYSCSPLNHITEDGGYSYQPFESFIMRDGTMEMRMAEFESDPTRLNRLNKIWIEYQKKLAEEIFSV
jgi:hypothetical protein